jgi:hypothetical protein
MGYLCGIFYSKCSTHIYLHSTDCQSYSVAYVYIPRCGSPRIYMYGYKTYPEHIGARESCLVFQTMILLLLDVPAVLWVQRFGKGGCWTYVSPMSHLSLISGGPLSQNTTVLGYLFWVPVYTWTVTLIYLLSLWWAGRGGTSHHPGYGAMWMATIVTSCVQQITPWEYKQGTV